MKFVQGSNDFSFEVFDADYIRGTDSGSENIVLRAQTLVQSDEISRFIYPHGDVYAERTMEFIHWLQKICFHSDVEDTFHISPSLSFVYSGRTEDQYDFQIRLEFYDAETFERFNYEEYPTHIFVNDEFSFNISVCREMLATGLEELTDNFREQLEILTGQEWQFI